MRVFVTGATGFIGRHVVRRLIQRGHQVCGLVRPTSDRRALCDLPLELAFGDVTDKASIAAGIGGCDWLIHLANLYSFWEADRHRFFAVNVTGTRNVLEAALDAGVSKAVHISSVVGYGKPSDRPFTEQSAPGQTLFSEYARTKVEGDRIAWELYETRRLPLVVIYPGAVLGAGDPKATGQYIANLVHHRMPAQVFPDKVMTFVHVRDVAEAICRAAEKTDDVGERYLVGAEQLSFHEINEMVAAAAGIRPPRMTLPEPIATMTAELLTGVANLIKRPPLWGLSHDLAQTMKAGFQFDGGKAARELGITYTPVRAAIEEAVAAIAD